MGFIKAYAFVELEIRESQHPVGYPLTSRKWELMSLSSVLQTDNSEVQPHKTSEDPSEIEIQKPRPQ